MLKKVTSSFLIRLLGIVLTFFAYSLMARIMTKHDYGVFMYFLTVIPIIAIFFRCGLDSLSINVYNNSEKYDFNEFFNASLFVILVVSSFTILVATFININTLYYCLFALPFALVYFLQAVMKASRNIFLSQFFEQVGLPIIMLVLVGYLLYTSNTISYIPPLILYGSVFICIFFILLYFVATKLSISFSLSKIKADNIKTYLYISSPLIFTTLLTALTPRIQTLMLGNLADDSTIAEFTVIARLAALTVFLSAAITHVFDPILIKNFYNDKGLCKKKLKKILLLGLSCNVIGVIFYSIFGEYILEIFGKDYVHLYPELVLLSISYALNVSFLPNLFVFIATKKQLDYVKIQFISMISLCGLSVLAYNNYGLIGLCYTSIFSNMLLSLVITFYTRKNLRL
ncbi:MAG: oligosaccharide flippase family protein [Proteobacteria bacterium]|nr:oligosaccharide flippase family protein [Pseudomonadota bacterium]